MRRRHFAITWFVILWMAVFLYETFRASYLGPVLHRNLPKLPLLFPPAGWIMFYNVDRSYGFAEVYGIQGNIPTPLDPHDVFRTTAVGYDNIHRNVAVGVLYQDRAADFCRYLRWKFPPYDDFLIVYAEYPDLISTPDRLLRRPLYRCHD